MNKTFITWSAFDILVNKLASKINKNFYTSIYGIPRGGIHVAQALSVVLDLPLVSQINEGTLVVDDIVDSGETLEKYNVSNKVAVLHTKGLKKAPHYFAEILAPGDNWIVYPWEIDDGEDEGISRNITRLLEYIGEDPKREGLIETPKRVEKAWQFWTKGYKEDPEKIMKTFDNPSNGEDHVDQLIIVPNIDFYSMCEHHLAPFYGTISIGYIPKEKVLGVSKFARLSEVYARRLQIQERLGQQIAEDVMKYLEPLGVAVVIRGIHLCMRSRGVEKQNTEMVTSVMLGYFRDKADLRAEFLNLIK